MRIDFLHQNIFGVGGTVRSVINMANALATDHDVRIVSVFRRVDRASLRIDSRVDMEHLVDLRPGGADRGNAQHNRRSTLVPPAEEYFRQYSELTDERIIDYLRNMDRDVIVGTRPSLNLLVAEYAHDRVVKVAQEHMTHSALPGSVVRQMRVKYERIDLVTAVTEADRERVARSLQLREGQSAVLSNSIPAPNGRLALPANKTIIAAGRLAPEKRYDVLLRAMARLAPTFPDWRLRLYGDGPLRITLAQLAEDLGIRDSVFFMGSTNDMDSEWVKGSISVSTSERESFGMSIVESMRRGVPVVSTDCPDGPREIITPGVDGLLVAVGDDEAVAAALGQLMRDEDKRRVFGRRAARNAARFDPTRVAEEFVRLLAEVRPALAKRTRRRRTPIEYIRAFRRGGLNGNVATVEVESLDERSLRLHSPELGRELLNAALHSAGVPPIVLREIVRRRRSGGIVIDTTTIPEGLWNLQAHHPRKRIIIEPAAIDTRVLAEAANHDTPGSFHRAIPYRNMHNRLGLRVWHRARHAELIAFDITGDDLRAQVKLMGDWNGDDLHWELVRGDAQVVCEGHVHRRDLRSIDFEISATDVAERRLARDESFSVQIRTGTGESVPVAHLAGDIADIRRIVTLPSSWVEDPADARYFRESGYSGMILVQGTVTRGNAIAVRCKELS